ncbi:MAG TPA: metalloregulator ArsR/SmtB family transcription factor [Tepidisphaeraceae bacterium]|jgi:ArsR family transcriptional regulator
MPALTRINQVDLMFRAVSDRTRLRLLNLLRTGEVCVCDLVTVLAVPQPKVSRHLAYLRRAGLVDARRDGQWMHYTLSPTRDTFHVKLLDCLASCARDVPELASDVKRMRLTRRHPGDGCC